MNQTQQHTAPYPVSGSSITKRRNSSAADAARNSFSERSFHFIFRALLSVLLICFAHSVVFSQSCPTSGTHSLSTNENTYYPGTQASVSAGATSITLGAAGSGTNFGATTISSGDLILIIQMQGAEIQTTNSKAYGSNNTVLSGRGFLMANLMAGQMEFAVATNSVPLTGGTLNLASGLVNSYASSAYGTYGQYSYQIIRVTTYYNIKLTANITAALWNGSTGGVVALNAVNTLDFNSHTISAAGTGFRGGAGRSLSGAGGTNPATPDYVTLSSVNANGSKGEGIAGTPKYVNNNGSQLNTGVEGYPSGSYSRGAPGNAGGGATDYDPKSNDQNAGGGGGGNGGPGGQGGWGWYLAGNSGGMGGLSFNSPTSPYPAIYSPSRLIMGGGGGAGTTNNGTGSPSGGFASSGAAGGGMVIISATAISGTGTVDVSGANANNTVTNDASGGGGAGGSILIYANSGHSGITAIANGGTGGSNDPKSVGATRHGPGGGGGGGIIYSNAALNAASSVTGGANGISTGTDLTDNFGAANGSNGVLTQTFPFSQLPPKMQTCQTTILPVTLLSFGASYAAANNVAVSWSTSSEINTSYFEVERSFDGSNFTAVGQVTASQDGGEVHNYNYNDYLASVNSSVVYYRLRMVDIDARFTYSKIVAVNLGEPLTKISVYPNPVTDYAVLSLYVDKQTVAMVRLMDDAGKQIFTRSFSVNTGNNSLMIDQFNNLPKGIYIVQVIYNNALYNQKLVKR